MEHKNSTLESGYTTLNDQEMTNELWKLSYSNEELNQLITLVWSMPDSFWVCISQRLIVGIKDYD